MARPALHHIRTRVWHMLRWPAVFYTLGLGFAFFLGWRGSDEFLPVDLTQTDPREPPAWFHVATITFFGGVFCWGAAVLVQECRFLTDGRLQAPQPCLPLGQVHRGIAEGVALLSLCVVVALAFGYLGPIPSESPWPPRVASLAGFTTLVFPVVLSCTIVRHTGTLFTVRVFGYAAIVSCLLWTGYGHRPEVAIAAGSALTLLVLVLHPALERIRLPPPRIVEGRHEPHVRAPARTQTQCLRRDLIRGFGEMYAGGFILGVTVGLLISVGVVIFLPDAQVSMVIFASLGFGFGFAAAMTGPQPFGLSPYTLWSGAQMGRIDTAYARTWSCIPVAPRSLARAVYVHSWLVWIASVIAGALLLALLPEEKRLSLSTILGLACIATIGFSALVGAWTTNLIGQPQQRDTTRVYGIGCIVLLFAFFGGTLILRWVPPVSILTVAAGLLLCCAVLTWDLIVFELPWMNRRSMAFMVLTAFALGLAAPLL